MKRNRRAGSVPQWWFMAFLATASILFPRVTAAQGLTGTLIGTVRDEENGAVPGVEVRLTSPALIGGPKTMRAGDGGQFRFQNLTSGTYTLDVETPALKYHKDDISIGADATLEIKVVLTVKGVAE